MIKITLKAAVCACALTALTLPVSAKSEGPLGVNGVQMNGLAMTALTANHTVSTGTGQTLNGVKIIAVENRG